MNAAHWRAKVAGPGSAPDGAAWTNTREFSVAVIVGTQVQLEALIWILQPQWLAAPYANPRQCESETIYHVQERENGWMWVKVVRVC